MARDKERSVNPAQAQRKADKAKALKKARNEQQARRNEKLARRNPNSIQRQIDDLKALEASGAINTREKAILADLERDLKAVLKAREVQGGKGSAAGSSSTGQTPSDRTGDRNNTILGKRRYDGTRRRQDDDHQSSGSDTDESVRNIPMPRDTPPPMPRDARRPPRQDQRHDQQQHDLPPKPAPVTVSQTTYASAPQIRDLKKEATSRFVPGAVRRKQNAARGQGVLLEPEEMDRLEQEGYFKNSQPQTELKRKDHAFPSEEQHTEVQDDEEAKRLQEEEERFQNELAESMNSSTDLNAEADSGEHQPFEDVKMNDSSKSWRELNGQQTQPLKVSDTKISTVQTNVKQEERPNDDDGRGNGDDNNENEDDDDDDDDDGDEYLPAILTAKPIPSSSSLHQQQQQPPQHPLSNSTANPSGASIAAGLFSKLPAPKHHHQQEPPSQQSSTSPSTLSHPATTIRTDYLPVTASNAKHVEMEEVNDEDL